MIMPRKLKEQRASMSEAHKAALKELEARRHEEGHKERVDAFNAMLMDDLGKENVGFILRSYS